MGRQLLHLSRSICQGIKHIQRCGKLVFDLGDDDLDRVIQLRTDLINLVIELVERQNCLAVGEIQIERDLIRSGQGVNHIRNRTDPIEGIEGIQCLGRVWHTNGYAISILDAQRNKRASSAVDPLHKLRIGGLLAHKLIGNQLGMVLRGLPDDLINGLFGIIQGLGHRTIKVQPGG